MLITLLSTLDLALIIIIPLVLVVGMVILLLCGVYHVRANRVYIIEKYNEFNRLLYTGWYFLPPLIYRRAAFYSLLPQYRTICLENGKYIKITYQIEDAKLYHYSRKMIDVYLLEITRPKSDITLEYLTEEYTKIGVKLISVQEVINHNL